jgi:hypothetical protein
MMSKRSKIVVFCFVLSAICVSDLAAQSSTQSPANLSTTSPASELDTWQSAQQSDTPNSYRDYLARFPNGAFAQLARMRSTPPILANMLPVAPAPENALVQTEIAAARTAWDEKAWARVKADGSHAAYREYLLHLPTGLHWQEAFSGYQRNLPVGPSTRLAECETADREAVKTKPFNIREAYPDYAIERWSDGLVIMRTHIDYTGRSLGATIDYASNLEMFGRGARQSASQILYTPALKNCAQIADSGRLIISYLMGDLLYESRQNAATPPLVADINTTLRGTLPPDRAVLIRFTPTPGISVYEINFQSRFPPMLSQLVDGRARPLPLVSNKLFITSSTDPITLRVSAHDKPNSRRQNMGPFRLSLRRVYNYPEDATLPTAPAVPPPTR